jgi:hypothetical protein
VNVAFTLTVEDVSLTLTQAPVVVQADDIEPPLDIVLAPSQEAEELIDTLAEALTSFTPTVTIDESPITIAPDSLTL